MKSRKMKQAMLAMRAIVMALALLTAGLLFAGCSRNQDSGNVSLEDVRQQLEQDLRRQGLPVERDAHGRLIIPPEAELGLEIFEFAPRE